MDEKIKTKQERGEENSMLKERLRELEQSEANLKQAMETLKAAEEKHLLMIENTDEAIFVHQNGILQHVNRACGKLLGVAVEDLIGMNVMDFIHPDYQKEVINHYRQLMHGEQTQGYRDVCLLMRQGEQRWINVKFIRVLWDGKESILAFATDITERKQVEEALKAHQTQLTNALEMAHLGHWEYDFASDAFTFNDQFYKIFRTTAEAVGGYTMPSAEYFRRFVHPDDLTSAVEIARKSAESMDTDVNRQLEHKIHYADGTTGYITVRNFTVRDARGRPIKMYGVNQDITERKQNEEEILQIQKLESLGVLAGGIAHDFNNLMAIVQGNIDLALLDLPPGHASRRSLMTAMKSIGHTRELTGRIITFSRGGGGPRVKTENLAEIVRETVQKTVAETEIRLTFDMQNDLWPAEIDEHPMRQCFYNLTKNAMEAMPEGGTLTVRGENVLIRTDEVLDLKEGSYLRISFIDEGVGIPEDNLSKIFDPYFTTKAMGDQKGLGLGLAVCYSIIKNHKGQITVQSKPGQGASFFLYLPACTDSAESKEGREASQRSKGRVLIMDDEEQLRVIERAYLERFGYEVTETEDGIEAIEAYRKALDSGNPFSLVIMDLSVRHGLGGQLAIERLLKIDPAVKVIIASGYTADPIIENYQDYGFQGVLEKPFSREQMQNLVEKILSGTD
ncbi:MAG: PAS domain S-box protein [Deltaproteobacteria bacterium]|nr:PAS domain S-box protein [Deltaproteobacteria bacterium]